MTNINVFAPLGSQSSASPVAVGSDVTTGFQPCSETQPDLETQANPLRVATLEFKGIPLISKILEDKKSVQH